MPPTLIDDADPDALISRLSRPLTSAVDREAFRTAAQDALAHVPVHGEGSNYRALKDLQRAFFTRRTRWDIAQELRDTKLKSAPAIEDGGDGRHRYRKHAR